jgi:endoglucanase
MVRNMKLRLALLLSVVAVALTPACALAAGNFANAGLPGASTTNPLAGMTWGVYRGSLDDLYSAWKSAHGTDRRLLAKEALEPLMYWFGSWNQDALAGQVAQTYIRAQTKGDPAVLSQMAIFRADPWEGASCTELPTAQQVANYKEWISNWAKGIGNSRVVMDLQPDMPFLGCIPDHSRVPAQELNYAAQVFSALPHTTVYIDAGASDWQSVSSVASLLREAGVQYTRGFALGATHYASTADELLYGQQVVRALGAQGITGMHFIINTAQNGRPFTVQTDRAEFKDQNVCDAAQSTQCVTLGIPPTTNVAGDPKADGLNNAEAAIAAQLCDAYLWFGRPWLENQHNPFELQRALDLAASTPF